MAKRKISPPPALLLKVEKAFHDFGYRELSMLGMAKACDLSTRALYNYFDNKEEAFRCVVQFRNDLALTTGFAAGRQQRENGGSALDILSAILNIRYGDTRRRGNASPHVIELNAEVFTRCNDIVMTVALFFEAALAKEIIELARAGLLQLRDDVNAEQLSRALSNGARGVNQRLPPVPPPELEYRYREMCQFVLYGGAELPAENARRTASGVRAEGEPR